MDREVNLETFLPRFRVLFQDFFTTIFAFNEDFLKKVIERLKVVILTYKDFEHKISDCHSDMKTRHFNSFVEVSFKLCIFMLLHDPVLTLNIAEYEKRNITYYYFNKNDYINIEGFGTDKSACAVILFPPILRNNFYYQGIKPAVYILPKIDDTIKQECEKNKPATPAHKRSSSINDPSIGKKTELDTSNLSPFRPIKTNDNVSVNISDTPDTKEIKEINKTTKAEKTEKVEKADKKKTLATTVTGLLDKKQGSKYPVSVTLQKLNNLKEKLSASTLELDEDVFSKDNKDKDERETITNKNSNSKVTNNLNDIEINDKEFNFKRIKEKLFKNEKLGNVMKTEFFEKSSFNNKEKDYENEVNNGIIYNNL